MKHILSINLFYLNRFISPLVSCPPECSDPPPCICSGESTSSIMTYSDTNPGPCGESDIGCGCGSSDNNNPNCDTSLFSCDTDICNPEDSCPTFPPPATTDLPCLRLDKCGIDWSWCIMQDFCDSDNPCGAPDTEGQPIG